MEHGQPVVTPVFAENKKVMAICTNPTQLRIKRSGPRYASVLTDAGFALILKGVAGAIAGKVGAAPGAESSFEMLCLSVNSLRVA